METPGAKHRRRGERKCPVRNAAEEAQAKFRARYAAEEAKAEFRTRNADEEERENPGCETPTKRRKKIPERNADEVAKAEFRARYAAAEARGKSRVRKAAEEAGENAGRERPTMRRKKIDGSKGHRSRDNRIKAEKGGAEVLKNRNSRNRKYQPGAMRHGRPS